MSIFGPHKFSITRHTYIHTRTSTQTRNKKETILLSAFYCEKSAHKAHESWSGLRSRFRKWLLRVLALYTQFHHSRFLWGHLLVGSSGPSRIQSDWFFIQSRLYCENAIRRGKHSKFYTWKMQLINLPCKQFRFSRFLKRNHSKNVSTLAFGTNSFVSWCSPVCFQAQLEFSFLLITNCSCCVSKLFQKCFYMYFYHWLLRYLSVFTCLYIINVVFMFSWFLWFLNTLTSCYVYSRFLTYK